MGKNHLKRLNAPRTWPISRKGIKWITKQNPGTHKQEESMPLNIIIRDLLKYAKISKEVKKVLHNKDILVDKKIRQDIKFPVGILDIIEIPKTKEHFLFLLNKKRKFFLHKINEKQPEVKYLKIINKTIINKNRLQINFYNGNNLIIKTKDYKVGDTLLMNLKDKKILKHLKLEKGAIIYLTGGKYVGSIGTLETVSSSNNLKKDMIELIINDKKVKTSRNYGFVIDKDIIIK